MGCENSKAAEPGAGAPKPEALEAGQANARQLAMQEEPAADRQPLLEQPAKITHERSNIILATRKDQQGIIDKLTAGEDFHDNRWRCIFNPESAYYTLSPSSHLEIGIVKGRKLLPAVSSCFEKYTGDEPDAFVKVFVDDVPEYTTRRINNSRHPDWNHEHKVDIVADRSIVRFFVYDSDSHDDTLVDQMGFVEICVGDMPYNQTIEGWFELRFPQNLQGINVDRYAEHCAQREDETKTPMPTRPQVEEGVGEDGTKKTAEKVDMTKVNKVRIPSSLASRLIKKAKKGMASTASLVTSKPASSDADHHAEAFQYNAGEIYLKLKLVPVVSESDLPFSKVLTPSYMTFATCVQEEFLPALELQELADDCIDIKIKVVDDMLFAVLNVFIYVLRWRSWFVSGMLFVSILTAGISTYLAFSFIFLWLANLMVLFSREEWRNDMTTGGTNAPLNAKGLEQVMACNDVMDMNNFVTRIVQSHLGTILCAQQLLHFAGTVLVGNKYGSKVSMDVNYEELVAAICALPFLQMPAEAIVAKGTLVRIDGINRAEVKEVRGKGPSAMVLVEYDIQDMITDADCKVETLVSIGRVFPRLTIPSLPLMLVPDGLKDGASLAMLQVSKMKLAVLPLSVKLRAFFLWETKYLTVPVFLYFLTRAGVSFTAFAYPEGHARRILMIMAQIRNGILGAAFLGFIVAQSRFTIMVQGVIQMVRATYIWPRNAPQQPEWKFYKTPEAAYEPASALHVGQHQRHAA
mmetsp:Transcript_65761/g.118502  ORF Transcript_65761/g.118502 Transcript_65761/m.118502 type:complete len:747 (+) Transcript_65761:107-2347(+)